MLKFLKSLSLLIVALALAVVLLPLGILRTIGEIWFRFFIPSGKNSPSKKGLWYLNSIIRTIAIGLDQIGNSVCRDMLNRLLITSGWYSFGKVQETISSVLGKNQETGTLTFFWAIIVKLLDTLDKNHCKDSIQYFNS
mgnify:CR=1 FL=1